MEFKEKLGVFCRTQLRKAGIIRSADDLWYRIIKGLNLSHLFHGWEKRNTGRNEYIYVSPSRKRKVLVRDGELVVSFNIPKWVFHCRGGGVTVLPYSRHMRLYRPFRMRGEDVLFGRAIVDIHLPYRWRSL